METKKEMTKLQTEQICHFRVTNLSFKLRLRKMAKKTWLQNRN